MSLSKNLLKIFLVLVFLLLAIFSAWVFVFGQMGKPSVDELPPPEEDKIISPEEFCGFSTKGDCLTNEDCQVGGCSGQVCQSKNEEPVISTCEYRPCYNADQYQLGCLCFNSQCQWQKINTEEK